MNPHGDGVPSTKKKVLHPEAPRDLHLKPAKGLAPFWMIRLSRHDKSSPPEWRHGGESREEADRRARELLAHDRENVYSGAWIHLRWKG